MSAQGKSGPKVRARAVADGQQVEIPALRLIRTVGTQEDRKTGDLEKPGQAQRQVTVGKSAV